MRKRLRASVALTLSLLACQTVQQKEESLESRTPYPVVRPGFEKIKVVIIPFQNSARLGQFDIIPDGDYARDVVVIAQPDKIEDRPAGPAPTMIPPPPPVPPDPQLNPPILPPPAPAREPPQNPPKVLPGDLYREIAETELFQSGRFEIVLYYQFIEERKRIDPGLTDATSTLAAAKNLGIQLMISGDCTDFEIKQSTAFWKLPFWALALIASIAVNNRDFRIFVWETLIRLAFAVPFDSPMWKAGVGWEDVDVDVIVSLNLRSLGQNGSVTFSDESTVKRTDTVRNLDLLVWRETNRVRIQKASAGRQIRFAAIDLVRKLLAQLDQIPVSAH